MTKLLEQAITVVSKLQDAEQDAVASIILEELASEKQWDAAFSNSAKALAMLAKEALAEYDHGKTRPLDV